MTGIEPNAQQSQPDPDPAWSPQPDPDPDWSPPPPRRPSPLWRPLGALLCFAAAILTLLGSFLTLLTTEVRESNNSRFALTITGWDVSATTNGRPDGEGAAAIFPTNGPPLVAAAVVLLAAAILAVFAAAAPASTAAARANSVVAAAGAAFLGGTTATILMEVLNWYERLRPNTPPGAPIQVDIVTTIGLGFWLIVAATAAALAGFVLTWLPLRRRARERIEPDTPAFGIPAAAGVGGAVVHRLPDEPPEELK